MPDFLANLRLDTPREVLSYFLNIVLTLIAIPIVYIVGAFVFHQLCEKANPKKWTFVTLANLAMLIYSEKRFAALAEQAGGVDNISFDSSAFSWGMAVPLFLFLLFFSLFMLVTTICWGNPLDGTYGICDRDVKEKQSHA